VLVRRSELPRAGFDWFSAKAPISNLFHQPGALLAFHPEDSLFDAVVEAADATLKRSGLSSAFVILEHFYDKVEPWAMAQTRRIGMRHEKAQLVEAPRFSPGSVAWTDWVVQRSYFNAAGLIGRQSIATI
jgi:hypothetical protein